MLPNEFGAGFLVVIVVVVVLAASFSATSTSILAKRVLCQTSLCSAVLQVAAPRLPFPPLVWHSKCQQENAIKIDFVWHMKQLKGDDFDCL